MIRSNKIRLLFFTMISWLFMQECPPSDTLSIEPIQEWWNIPSLDSFIENQWDKIEVMTWNIEEFPISNNTIDYVNEIITDILPDIIAFQEINNSSAFNTLANSIPAYEFINSGNGLALAARSDVIEITNWSTLFSNAGDDFVYRYPLLVELNWLCGMSSLSIQIINIHLKAGNSSEDFDKRFNACEYLAGYVIENPNTNIIILGDYNDEITDSESENSLWPLVSNNAIAFATDPIANIDHYASYPSYPSFIDHIALSTPLFDELSGGNITTIRVDDATGWNFYHDYISDHRPVLWSFSVEEVELATGLVINEIMQNPNAVIDMNGEWIEITNISNDAINLNGLILKDGGDEEHIISDNSLIVEPDGNLVLGANDDFFLNGGVVVDYEYSEFFLSNNWDAVILVHPTGMIIDEVHYDNGDTFPDEDGRSMMLLDPILDNSLGENWVAATVVFGSGDFGTPGQDNDFIDCTDYIGDVNGDGEYNVLDIVTLANCILSDTCSEYGCTGDLNGDGDLNILDIVMLANCVLSQNCDG